MWWKHRQKTCLTLYYLVPYLIIRVESIFFTLVTYLIGRGKLKAASILPYIYYTLVYHIFLTLP